MIEQRTILAQEPPQNLSLFPLGEPNVAYAEWFSGRCWLNLLTKERCVTLSGVKPRRLGRGYKGTDLK